MTRTLTPAAIPALATQANSRPITARLPAGRVALVCLAVFCLLVGWVSIFRYSGEGDAVLHFLNARDAWVTPADALGAWARPLFKLIIAGPATLGLFPAQATVALITSLAIYQTIRLAEDLHLPRAILAAPMLLWQPMAFGIAADTLTEMPFALGMVAAVRLWLHRRTLLSCLLVSLLPMIRPEGFFFIALWGAMVAFRAWHDDPRGRGFTLKTLGMPVVHLLSLGFGMLIWCALCAAISWDHDPLYFLHVWSWPISGGNKWGYEHIVHYIIRWPVYCGLALTPLFFIGLVQVRSELRKTRPNREAYFLIFVGWALVFVPHAIMYATGTFQSAGLLRILAAASPFTALICLIGWNSLVPRLRRPRLFFFAFAVGATALVFAQQLIDAHHLDFFPASRAAAWLKPRIQPGQSIFVGNKIVLAELGLPPHPQNVMQVECNAAFMRKQFAELPIGAIGIWDNQQSPDWHTYTIEQLKQNGFAPLHEESIPAISFYSLVKGGPLLIKIRYVVLQKVGPFDPPP